MFLKKISIFLLAVLIILLPTTVGCGEKLNEYNVNVQNYMSYGIVEGSGTFLEGTNVTITAKPIQASSNQFKCWIHNYEIVSFDNNYTFIMNKESSGTYIAIFDMNEPALITMDSFKYTQITNQNNENIELKNIQIYYSTNELSYMLTYDFKEGFESISYESITDFKKPFALLNTNDLYLKITEQYLITSDETGDVSNITTTTEHKILKNDIIESIANNEVIETKLNEPVENVGNPLLSIKFNYIDNYDIDQLFKNTDK